MSLRGIIKTLSLYLSSHLPILAPLFHVLGRKNIVRRIPSTYKWARSLKTRDIILLIWLKILQSIEQYYILSTMYFDQCFCCFVIKENLYFLYFFSWFSIVPFCFYFDVLFGCKIKRMCGALVQLLQAWSLSHLIWQRSFAAGVLSFVLELLSYFSIYLYDKV